MANETIEVLDLQQDAAPGSSKPEWMTNKPWFCRHSSQEDYEKSPVTESLESGDVTMADGIPNVYALHSDGGLLIEQHDLRRVVITNADGTYRIEKELLTIEDAAAFVEKHNASLGGDAPRAEVIDYVEAWRRARAIEYRRWKIEEGDGLCVEYEEDSTLTF